MRGLTPTEASVSRLLLSHGQGRVVPSEAEVVALRSLYLAGRVDVVQCDGGIGPHRCAQLTPSGRAALRLHELLAAMGGAP